MDYSSSLDYLYALQHFGIKLGLENTQRLLSALDNPQDSLRIVHIAGTNGKGSTAAALEQILRYSGFRTGLYTSPHLDSFTERIRIDNRPISEAEVVDQIRDIRKISSDLAPTFFEFTTAMALRVFAQQEVDWVILETGLGGRLDSTNVVDPQLCIITPVDIDHAALLGENLTGIAAEKGGIIKPGVPVVCARQRPEAMEPLQEISRQQGAPLFLAGLDFSWTLPPASFDFTGTSVRIPEIESGLAGAYQRENLSLALAAAEILLGPETLDPALMRRALAELRWAGRLECCGDFLLDGAHNPHAAKALAEYLAAEQIADLLWVVAVKADKDIFGILEPVLPFVQKVFAAPLAAESSAPPARLVDMAKQQAIAGELFDTPLAALDRAIAQRKPGQKVLIAGSLFLVAELRQRCLLLAGGAT